MEVVNQKVAMLSNFEVLSLLKTISANEKGQKKYVGDQQQLATVSYETTKYLEGTPCQLQDEEIIKRFLKAVMPFKLTKSEKLQILNHRPSTPVEIQLMVEEIEERLNEEEILNLLTIITDILPCNQVLEENAAESME